MTPNCQQDKASSFVDYPKRKAGGRKRWMAIPTILQGALKVLLPGQQRSPLLGGLTRCLPSGSCPGHKMGDISFLTFSESQKYCNCACWRKTQYSMLWGAAGHEFWARSRAVTKLPLLKKRSSAPWEEKALKMRFTNNGGSVYISEIWPWDIQEHLCPTPQSSFLYCTTLEVWIWNWLPRVIHPIPLSKKEISI